MISRHHKKLVWQYINWQSISEYVDNLKSRIYKAFFEKSPQQVYHLQYGFIISPLVILLALRERLNVTCYYRNSFELGYLLFCLSNNYSLDVSFYYYYKENFSPFLKVSFHSVVEQIKYLVVMWCIESYQNYLLDLKTLLYYKADNINLLRNFIDYRITSYNYILCLNLNVYLNYFDLHALIEKMLINKLIKKYLLDFFNVGIFDNLRFYFSLSSSYKLLKKHNRGLFYKLLDIFVFYICYEILSMLSCSFFVRYDKESIIFLRYDSNIFVFTKEFLQIKTFYKNLDNFLFFNGASIVKTLHVFCKSVFEDVYTNSLFINFSNQVGQLHFLVKPSLSNQLNLIKQISLILKNGTSKSLSLFFVRLNMLLVLWLDIYVNQPIVRIIYLIDYLISLKLRVLAKKKSLCYIM